MWSLHHVDTIRQDTIAQQLDTMQHFLQLVTFNNTKRHFYPQNTMFLIQFLVSFQVSVEPTIS